MGLSRLAEQCRKCPFKAEAGASSAELTQPILRETVNTIIGGKVVKVYKDEIEKQLHKELYSHLDIRFGG